MIKRKQSAAHLILVNILTQPLGAVRPLLFDIFIRRHFQKWTWNLHIIYTVNSLSQPYLEQEKEVPLRIW